MTFSDLKGRLVEKATTTHFLLLGKPGRGVRAGLDDALVNDYRSWLEEAYNHLTAPPFRRARCAGLQVRVFVLDTREVSAAFQPPFTDVDNSGPYLVLPSEVGYSKASKEDAVAATTTEVTRMFNGFVRHPRDPLTTSWAWFDAGFASMVGDLTRSEDPVRFPIRASLSRCFEALGSESYARALVEQLSLELGIAGLNNLWLRGSARPEDTPLEALDRYYGLSPEYLLSSFHKHLYVSDPLRFDDDDDAIVVEDGECFTHECRLDHAAYRWYRLQPREDLGSLVLRLESSSSTIVAQVGVVDIGGEFHSVRSFERQTEVGLSAAHLTNVPAGGHLALIVTNFGTRGVNNPQAPHFDGLSYSITIRAFKAGA
jgi:hypothetical protein